MRDRTHQQIRNLLFDSSPTYLLHDNDPLFKQVGNILKSVRTAPKSPWQNAIAERLIGSIRRECLDHLIVMSGEHLKVILKEYFSYYQEYRLHLSLEKNSPAMRSVEVHGSVVAIPKVGGLHHYYGRMAA